MEHIFEKAYGVRVSVHGTKLRRPPRPSAGDARGFWQYPRFEETLVHLHELKIYQINKFIQEHNLHKENI